MAQKSTSLSGVPRPSPDRTGVVAPIVREVRRGFQPGNTLHCGMSRGWRSKVLGPGDSGQGSRAGLPAARRHSAAVVRTRLTTGHRFPRKTDGRTADEPIGLRPCLGPSPEPCGYRSMVHNRGQTLPASRHSVYPPQVVHYRLQGKQSVDALVPRASRKKEGSWRLF